MRVLRQQGKFVRLVHSGKSHPKTFSFMARKFSFYLYLFYCFEIGIFLVAAPWWIPQVWEQNYFFFLVPGLKKIFMNGFFRGAISGLGVLNILLAIDEIIQHERVKHYTQ